MPTPLIDDASALVERTRRTLNRQGVTRHSLNDVRQDLIALATHPDLQDPATFAPDPNGHGRLYRLHEDPNGGYALYVNVCGPNTQSPPHDHTTWAVIAGVEGAEHNTFYEEARHPDDAPRHPGHAAKPRDPGPLQTIGHLAITPGRAIALLPDDIHSIDTRQEPRVVCLHFYGLALPQQTHRRAFTGPDTTHYAPQPEIVDL